MTETIYALGYARVSTAKQAAEGDSLPIQARIIASEIKQQGWTIHPAAADVLQEPFTGTTHARPEYQRAIQIIKAHPSAIKYFVVRTIDRFSREGSPEYLAMKAELASMGVELRDTYHVIQPSINTLAHTGFEYEWSRFEPSRKSEIAEAEAGKQEIMVMLTRMIGAEIDLVQKGYHIGNPDDGYVIQRLPVDDKKRCVLKPDPERAHFFRLMFELRAAGLYTDREIVDHVNGLGFRTKPRNRWNADKTKIVGHSAPKLLTVKRLQCTITRPIYCGVIMEFWTRHQPTRARGEAIVCIETYNRANRGARYLEERPDGSLRMLYDRSPERVLKKRNTFDQRWPYKNVVLCPTCRLPLWASASRGRSGQKFTAYHCARTHDRYSVKQSVLDQAFRAYLASVGAVDGLWDTFSDVVRAEYARFLEASKQQSARGAEMAKELLTRKDQLIEAFTAATSPSIRRSLEEKVEAIDRELAATTETRLDLSASEADLDDFLAHVRKVLEHPARILDFIREKTEQVALYRLFFEVFPTYEEIVSGTAKLTPTFASLQTPGGPESGVVGDIGHNWNTIQHEIDRWKEAYWAIDLVYERMMEQQRLSGSREDKKAAGRPSHATANDKAA